MSNIFLNKQNNNNIVESSYYAEAKLPILQNNLNEIIREIQSIVAKNEKKNNAEDIISFKDSKQTKINYIIKKITETLKSSEENDIDNILSNLNAILFLLKPVFKNKVQKLEIIPIIDESNEFSEDDEKQDNGKINTKQPNENVNFNNNRNNANNTNNQLVHPIFNTTEYIYSNNNYIERFSNDYKSNIDFNFNKNK